ncbi:Type III flagellar switch regulator (C-ring) FliN C-term [Antarctobacter heliothermus]|uniref:Type III flagellar switch regulator (C-ring) FliN C-term n=2 Tax=Antarctobacter heliothermus TaxID=74033 RepID=A0A239KFH3_9RHOB|nr:Type III flagellar switch regulator (C-ring) FliN C-term [Antarctobacter heliothermus]
MSLAKALRRALSRTADVLWDLALVTQSVTVETMDQDDVVEALGKTDLLVLLDGPDGAIGIASVDCQVMTGVIEVQTIQQVTQMPVEDDRVLTQTDAAMLAPLLDGALGRLADTLTEHPLHSQLVGYRFGAMIEDSRAAGLLLEAAGYRSFRADIDLALGRRRGVLTFFLPECKPKRGAPGAVQGVGPHEERLSRVPARLDAALARITLPLSKAEALKPGDVLNLPLDALSKVEVMAGHGHLVARGRLGQLNGLRAVRLTWPGGGAAPVAAANPAGAASAATAQADKGASFDGPQPVSKAGLPVLSDVPVGDPVADADLAEDLPDLPPMDFESNSGGFDFSDLGEDLGDIDNAQPMEALPELDISDGFASASMDFDFEEK